MIPLHSSWFQWGHGEVIYIPFFSKKKTPQHHSNTPQCLDCRRSAIATLHQRLTYWRSATRPRKWHKCLSYEAYEETLEKLQSTPHSTSCSMIFFYFLPTQLTSRTFLWFSHVFSQQFERSLTLKVPPGSRRCSKAFTSISNDWTTPWFCACKTYDWYDHTYMVQKHWVAKVAKTIHSISQWGCFGV